MKIKLELDRRQWMGVGGVLVCILCYFMLVTGPNSETLDGLSAEVGTKTKQIGDLEELAKLLAECDKLTAGQAEVPMSIESRVEKVGRELGLHPTISKRLDASITEPNKVDVVLGNLYLRDMIEFLRRIEAFPVTVQILRLQISKQQNVATVSLTLSDLNL